MVIGYRLNSSDNSKNGEKNGRYCPHGLSTTYCTIYLTQASVQIEPQFSTCHWTPNHSQILQDSKFGRWGNRSRRCHYRHSVTPELLRFRYRLRHILYGENKGYILAV